MLLLVSLPNDSWETRAEIPYWRRITQIWALLLIGCAVWEIWVNQSEALPRSGKWRVISMEFLHLFLRRHLMGNQYMVVLPNVSCFLRLPNECRTQRLTRIDFQISFNPDRDGQIDDGFLKDQSWNEITMTLNIYSGSWIYIGYNIPLSHTDRETVTRVCHYFDSLTQ